jgi:hypothetical protein
MIQWLRSIGKKHNSNQWLWLASTWIKIELLKSIFSNIVKDLDHDQRVAIHLVLFCECI